MARFARLALPALLLAGCGSENTMEPPPPAPVGDVVVSWSIVDGDDQPTTCTALGFIDAVVNLGGRERVIPCGESEQVEFKMVPHGRQPILIQLRIIGNVIAEEQISNVVLDGEQVEKELVFKVDRQAGNTGTILASWLINAQPAFQGCLGVGGASVAIKTVAGSIEEFMTEVPCTDGEVTFSDVRTGAYQLQFELLDDNGGRIQLLPTPDFVVVRGETAPVRVFFGEVTAEFGSILARWTVTGSAAVDSCPLQSFVRVRLSVPNPRGGDTEIRSSTVACDRGELLEQMLSPDLTYDLSMRLRDPLNTPLSDAVNFRDIDVDTSSTTTVTADLIADI